MKPLAFISHSEIGGRATSAGLRKTLQHQDLDLDSFYSETDINSSDIIHEKIIRNIVNADILIGVIDPFACTSKWVKWEHDFCKKRNLTRTSIVFLSVWNKFKQNEIPFLDKNELVIIYEYNIDILLSEFFTEIEKKKDELDKRFESKIKIQITLDSLDDVYQNTDTIKISGQVKSTELDFLKFNPSIIYLHRINNEPDAIPIANRDLINPIDYDENGKFSHDCKISEIDHNIDTEQKWFFEIRFDNKSEIVATTICPSDSDTRDTLPPKTPSSVTTISDSFNVIQEKIKSISLGTSSSISKRIKDYTIDRNKEISKLVEDIKKHDKIVITGNKGSGKSVILCALYHRLKENNDILFVRCDDYLHIQNISEFERIIFEDKSIYNIVQKNYSKDNKLLIIFDSLDTISRNSRVFEIFKQFLKQLWGTDKIRTVCSVRDYDYQYSPSISSTDWGENFELDELSDIQLELTLNHLKSPKISQKLRPILKNPLNLKLLSLILEKSSTSDLHSIISEIDLYNEYWKEYVEKSEKPLALKKILFAISKEMIEKQRTVIITPDNCLQDLSLALNTNLLEKDSDTNTIQFFHHAYLDYVVSRYILENFENLDEFIVEQKYNIFLRPTIVFTFSILQMKNQESFLRNVKKILTNNEIKYYWKFSILHVFSTFETNEFSKIDTFGELLSDDLYLRQHFLRESTKSKNPFWFNVWKDSFIQIWANDLQTNNRFLLEYLKSILPVDDPIKLFESLKIIVEKNYSKRAKKTAIEIASRLNIEKSDWYLKLSNDKNSYVRWGVIVSLSQLIDDGTKDLNKMFSNVFLFKNESNDMTERGQEGSLRLQSNRSQDKMMVVWVAEQNFNKLLEKLPSEFLLSVITIIEYKQKDHPKQEGTIIEDGGYVWYDSSLSEHGENKLLLDIEKFLKNCSVSKLKELIPMLTKSRLATLHKIAITTMLDKMDSFKDTLFSELLIPEIYKIKTLENTIKHAIKEISPLLSESQIQSILKRIMEINFQGHPSNMEIAIKHTKLHKAIFLSSIPIEKLSLEQKELLEQYSEKELEELPEHNFNVTFEPDKEFSKERETPERIIDSLLEQNPEGSSKIKLLNAIHEYLSSKTKDLDPLKFSSFKNFLLSNISDQDPKENSQYSQVMSIEDTVRGITSKCLIRLYYHSKDEGLAQDIEKLSDDKINIVRADIAHDLIYLYFINPTLTLKIVEKYSIESDDRVHFYLTDIVSRLADKYPQETTHIIKNIIDISKSKDGKLVRHYNETIVFLALIKQDPTAESILNDLIINPDFPDECKEDIPFILKESYLYNESTQDAALKGFLKFLDNKNHIIREKATFFLLATLDDVRTSEAKKIIEKIGPHLDKIAKEIEREKWDLRIIEELVRFLKKNWMYMQKKSVEYLQRISKDNKKYLEFQSMIASDTIVILNGLFRESTLDDENKQYCLDILDKFVSVGWPEALELLSIMERND